MLLKHNKTNYRCDSLRRLLYDHTRCLAKLPYKALAKQFGADRRAAYEDDDEDGTGEEVIEVTEDFICKLVKLADIAGTDITITYGGRH